jgi:hypothetical protein
LPIQPRDILNNSSKLHKAKKKTMQREKLVYEEKRGDLSYITNNYRTNVVVVVVVVDILRQNASYLF